MKKYLLIVLLFSNVSLFAAWGLYDFDRSYVTFNVNESPATKTVWNSGAGNYQTFDFGTFVTGNTFQLTGYDVKTFKNGGSDVTGGTFYYVIYPKGIRPTSPIFTGISLVWIENIGGGGDQKWGFSTATANMLTGLTAGEYTIEIYSDVTGTTPNTTVYDNNNGNPSNYTAHFRYNYVRSIADASWSLTTTWLNNIVPNSSEISVEINSAVAHDGNYTCNGLTVNSSKTLTIKEAKTLTVSGTIVNNANIAGLVLETGASLLHNTDGIEGSVQRIIYEDGKWHFISSPNTGAMPIICDDDFAPTTFNSTTGPTYDFFKYDENVASGGVVWINLKNTDWSLNTIDFGATPRFVAGKGYLVEYQAEFTGTQYKKFTGTLANGTQNIPVTATGNKYNLVGNPFCSSIDWKAASGWTRSVLATSGGGNNIWIWNGAFGNYGVYNSADADDFGTNSISRYIATAQGFMVQAATSGDITLTNAVRVPNIGTQVKSGELVARAIRIKVSSPATPYSDEIKVVFGYPTNQGGAAKWWSMYNEAPSIYTVKSNQNYSLNFLTTVEDNQTIPLNFKAGVDGTYSFTSAFDESSFENIILQDLKTGITQDLKVNPVYSFVASTSDDAARFILKFDNVGINDPQTINSGIYSYSNKICVENSGKATLEVFNMAGQRILSQEINSSGLYQTAVNDRAGYYVVRLTNALQVKVSKVYVQ